MHIHQSLFSNQVNVFYDKDDPLGLSKICRNYIAGILKHARAFTAITNPCVNSYKRLVPGYEAPVYVAWSTKNRSSLVRIPSATGEGTRIELRSPDPVANPYLALAVTLEAGLEGIRNNLAPGPECYNNIFEMTDEERQKAGIPSLPTSLFEALGKTDEVIKRALGEHVFTNYVNAKTIEWNRYRTQVHKWELDEYLSIT